MITDAIRDEKVLKFKVDYNDVRPQFKAVEAEQDEKKLSAAENRQALLHPERIREITQYILNQFRQKTHRLNAGGKGFKRHVCRQQRGCGEVLLRSVQNTTGRQPAPVESGHYFSFAANEEQNAVGEIVDETFEPEAMDSSAKEFLQAAINDYNACFKTNFGTDSKAFQNYYRDLAKRVKTRKWIC